ncbi:MAG: hypothetical protein QGG73_08625 [Candidatus Hydrogenedentes bacterium]|jgi:hypothetical protein|nr:hypothetical protein [Candidatus Hydrogenedentota bacterium]
METEDYMIHSRNIEGIDSCAVTDWFGTPMNGVYFVKSTLPGGIPSHGNATSPIVLIPGGFDPHFGEYSNALIRDLLERVGAPAVYEAHFCHEEQAGFLHVRAFIEDLAHICTDPSAQPVIVGLCAGTLALFGGLLAATERSPNPSALGALSIGSYIPHQLNLLGRSIRWSARRLVERDSARLRKYAGHNYLFQTGYALTDWYAESNLLESLLRARPNKAEEDRFPIPVEVVYFGRDILNARTRRRLRNLFDAPKAPKKVRGLHRSLRKSPDADSMIASFYQRMRAPHQELEGRADSSGMAVPLARVVAAEQD